MIRQATRHDIPRLLQIVEAYSYETPITALGKQINHDPSYVSNLLFSIIAGRGFIFVSDSVLGALIAVRQANVWAPKVRELHELLWWVEPEHRKGSVGGRLWKMFDERAAEMLNAHSVDVVITSLSADGPPLDYTRRGYRAASTSFVRER